MKYKMAVVHITDVVCLQLFRKYVYHVLLNYFIGLTIGATRTRPKLVDTKIRLLGPNSKLCIIKVSTKGRIIISCIP